MITSPLRRGLIGAVVVASTAAVLPAAAAAAAPGWRIAHRTPAAEGNPASLHGITAVGPRNAWAVGDKFRPDTGPGVLIKHWNGTGWKELAVPSSVLPSGTPHLTHVAATSAKNVVAFGRARDTGFAVRWDGSRWSSKVFGAKVEIVDATAVPGSAQIWAVGRRCAAACKSVAYRFDGKAWRTMPGLGSKTFFGAISARTPKDVWAAVTISPKPSPLADRTGLARWDGKKWRVRTAPKSFNRKNAVVEFTDVVARGPKDIWATVGYRSPAVGRLPGAVLARWNGKSWKRFAVNSRDHLVELAVDGRGGFWLLDEGANPALVRFRDGKARQRLVIPRPKGSTVYAYGLVRIPGTKSLWAAGELNTRGDTLGVIWKHGS